MADNNPHPILTELEEKIYKIFEDDYRYPQEHTVTIKKIKLLLSESLQQAYKQSFTAYQEGFENGKKETVEKYKPTLDSVHIVDWLRGRYGLSDGDTLDTGEVQEMLEQFVYDHSLSPQHDKEEK